MEEKNFKAPAVLLLKSMKKYLDNLDRNEKGLFLEQALAYSVDRTMPKNDEGSFKVNFCFMLFKDMNDENEKRYAEKCERNKKYYEKRKSEREKARENEKAEESQQTKPRERQKPIRAPVELTKEQESFLKSFKEHLPNKIIDCQITDFPNIDYNALMLEIKRSPQFLMDDEKSKSFNLRWYLEHAEKIIAGNYKEFGDKVKSNFSTKHDYTKDEMNSLFQKIEDIEV